nr:uncharacterized protein LOC124807376 [Hydra vulgaris]
MKLLSKILASLEEVKQTQKLHSAMIISLQKQQSVDSGITIQQLPAGLTLPLHSFADVDNAEVLLKDESVQKILTKVFIENGGSDIGDFIKRNMKLLFDSALAKHYNLTGVSRQGKRGFNKLIMFQLLYVK